MWSRYPIVGPPVHPMGPNMIQKKGFATTIHVPDVQLVEGKSFSNPNFVNKNNAFVHNYKNHINMEKNNHREKSINSSQIFDNKKNSPESSSKMEISSNSNQPQIIMMENNDTNASDNISSRTEKPIVLSGIIFGCNFDIDLNQSNCDRNKCLNSFVTPKRERQLSVTSEDNFIIFDCDYDESDNSYEEENDEEDELNDDNDIDNEIEHNDVVCTKPTTKKVRFASDDVLCEIHPMVQWSYAYRQARQGPWERYARDAERFKVRIKRTEDILLPIFDLNHRKQIYQSRFNNNNNNIT